MNATLRTRRANRLLAGIFISFMFAASAFASKVKVGEQAPDFAVLLLDGQRTVRLSDFRGHRVLIFTWASW